jgi:hypothetical protein
MKRLRGPNNADTFTTNWAKTIWNDCRVHHEAIVIDPFARNCKLGSRDFRNDLNPETNATHHLEALEFLQSLDSDFADFVIFDPPFSDRMANDHYDGFGTSNLYTQNNYIKSCYQEIDRLLKPNGGLLRLGYNSNRPLKTFELETLWLIAHGGHRRDTIASLWRKNTHTLREYGLIIGGENAPDRE